MPEFQQLDIQFTDTQMTLFLLRGLFEAALPFLCWFYLRLRRDARIFPVLIGVIAMILLALPRAMLRTIFMRGTETFLGKFMISCLIGAACEECGRFVAMKYAMPNHDTVVDALCYGLGHGGVENIASAVKQFQIFAETKAFTGFAAPENVERLTTLSQCGGWDAAEFMFDTVMSIVFQVSASLLVRAAVHYDGTKKYLAAAIGLHVLVNTAQLFFGTGGGAVVSILTCLFAVHLSLKLRDSCIIE